jgi:hypothetical protein
MRAARDLILVICAIISTACFVYLALHVHSLEEEASLASIMPFACQAVPAGTFISGYSKPSDQHPGDQ